MRTMYIILSAIGWTWLVALYGFMLWRGRAQRTGGQTAGVVKA